MHFIIKFSPGQTPALGSLDVTVLGGRGQGDPLIVNVELAAV